MCGALEHLLNRGDDCPKVLASTHFHGKLSNFHSWLDAYPDRNFREWISASAAKTRLWTHGSSNGHESSRSTGSVDISLQLPSRKKRGYIRRHVRHVLALHPMITADKTNFQMCGAERYQSSHRQQSGRAHSPLSGWGRLGRRVRDPPR